MFQPEHEGINGEIIALKFTVDTRKETNQFGYLVEYTWRNDIQRWRKTKVTTLSGVTIPLELSETINERIRRLEEPSVLQFEPLNEGQVHVMQFEETS